MISEMVSYAWSKVRGTSTRSSEWDKLRDLDSLGGRRASSGVNVSYKNMLTLGAVWQCVEQISGDIAKQPLDLFVKDGRKRVKDEGHPVFNIVRWEANEEQHAFDFWRTILVHALIYNNGYAYILRANDGTPMELIPLLPDRTYSIRRNGKRLYQTSVYGDRERPTPHVIPAEDVFHIKGISFDGMSGVDRLYYVKESFGIALAAQGFAGEFFAHGMQAGGILEIPLKLAQDEKALRNIEEGFRKKQTGQGNWFKTAILRDGVKFQKITMTPNEGQMIETSDKSVRDAARFYNMNPSRLGLSDSVSYNSKEEDNQSYLDTTLCPWMLSITSECRKKLLTEDEKRGRYFEHNSRSILSMAPLKRGQLQAIQIRNGVISPNEAREAENLNPREGGDEYIELNKAKSPGGMDKGENDKPRGPANDTPDEAQTEDDSTNDNDEGKRRRIIFDITARARHKAQRGGNAFLEWVDNDLKQHRDQAIELLGNDNFINPIVERMKELAEKTGVNELFSVVEAVTAEIEQQS